VRGAQTFVATPANIADRIARNTERFDLAYEISLEIRLGDHGQ